MGGILHTFGRNSNSFLPFSTASQARTLVPVKGKTTFLVLLFIVNMVIAQEPKDSLTFTLRAEMISHFDQGSFEIYLTDSAIQELSRVDFSYYSYVTFENCNSKVFLLESTMSFRPPDILIYRHMNSIFFSPGKIKIEIRHLPSETKEVKELMSYLIDLNE